MAICLEEPARLAPAFFDNPDRDLILRAKAGDQAAFTSIYNDNYRCIGKYLKKNRVRQEDIEETVQNTFIRFFKRLERVDENKPVRPLLYSIARRLAINLIVFDKRQCRDSAKTTHLSDKTLYSQEDFLDGKNEVLRLTQRDELQRAMGTLSPRAADILRKVYFEKARIKDVSLEFEIHKQTVKNSLVNSLKTLRKHFEAREQAELERDAA